MQSQGHVEILVYSNAATKAQLAKEAVLSITKVALLQTMKAAHVPCHAIRVTTMSAVLMQ